MTCLKMWESDIGDDNQGELAGLNAGPAGSEYLLDFAWGGERPEPMEAMVWISVRQTSGFSI